MPCPEGKVRNKATGRCRNKSVRRKMPCPEGKVRNKATGRCRNKSVRRKSRRLVKTPSTTQYSGSTQGRISTMTDSITRGSSTRGSSTRGSSTRGSSTRGSSTRGSTTRGSTTRGSTTRGSSEGLNYTRQTTSPRNSKANTI
jgi:hypothetical protein